MERLLDTHEAARRLGVKPETLYAYVSRGRLSSHPAPDGRSSRFAADEVEALARRGRGGRQVETRLATVTTAITQLTAEGPRYRGRAAAALAESAAYEDVADLLWRAQPGPWTAPPAAELALDVARAIGPEPPPHDLLRLAAVVAATADPLRADRRPSAVAQAARRLIASMIEALPLPRRQPRTTLVVGGRRRRDTVAERLTARLTDRRTHPALVGAVNRAMVLMADHELATSTVAARVAASTRADVYDVVLAGLGAMGGPLHGSASPLVHEVLTMAAERGAERAISDAMRWRGSVAGFGHPIYTAGDPRAPVLLAVLDDLVPPSRRIVIQAVCDLAATQGLPPANVDFALGALAYGTGMTPFAGEVISTVARVAGWVAHALEEYEEPPLRFRARSVYAVSETE